jgi:hypothetical protein
MRFAFKTSPQNTAWSDMLVYLPAPPHPCVLAPLAESLSQLG